MAPSLILSRRLRERGDSTLGLERGARAGRFVRVRPGAYMPTNEWMLLDARERHLAAMEALHATARRRVVFAVESAALLHHLPVVGGWPALPRVVASDSPKPRGRTGTSPRWRPVETSDIVHVDGMWATSRARTAIDLAAERDLVSGVAALDAALARGAEREELARRVDADRPFRGARKVDVALSIATGASESVLESLSLVRILELGFPRPEQQAEFDVGGELFRVDFWWPEQGVVGEADGLEKYESRVDLIREKHREDALRTVVPRFVRWGWAEAWGSNPLEAGLAGAGLPRSRRSASVRASGT